MLSDMYTTISGGGGGGGAYEDTTADTSDDDPNVTPTGALNPFNYNVEDTDGDGDGEVQETTLGGNTVADVVDSVDYSDTSVDEQASTADEPSTSEEIIDAAASGGSNPEFESEPDTTENTPNPNEQAAEDGNADAGGEWTAGELVSEARDTATSPVGIVALLAAAALVAAELGWL